MSLLLSYFERPPEPAPLDTPPIEDPVVEPNSDDPLPVPELEGQALLRDRTDYDPPTEGGGAVLGSAGLGPMPEAPTPPQPPLAWLVVLPSTPPRRDTHPPHTSGLVTRAPTAPTPTGGVNVPKLSPIPTVTV